MSADSRPFFWRITSPLTALALVSSGGVASAADPGWWAGVTTSNPAENYAVANLGQGKNFADHAFGEFDTRFDISLGFTRNDLFPYPQNPATVDQNYSPLNLGQLKALSAPFYDFLHEHLPGYLVPLFEHNGIDPSWPHRYPWDPSTPVSENYSPANLGQLKLVFRFDFAIDSDSDSLPDWWEQFHFGTNSETSTGDYDGDGVTNAAEFAGGTDPAEFPTGDSDEDGKTDSTEPPLQVVGKRDHIAVGLVVQSVVPNR